MVFWEVSEMDGIMKRSFECKLMRIEVEEEGRIERERRRGDER